MYSWFVYQFKNLIKTNFKFAFHQPPNDYFTAVELTIN